MPPVAIGAKAPAFSLKDQSGTTHTLAGYAGRPLVLYFYPKDDTSVCTEQACAFNQALPEFGALGAAVLGVSILDTRSKAKFAAKNKLTFPLLADEDNAVSGKYGVWVEKSMYGKAYMGIARTTFLIDPAGKVAQRWDNVKVPGHIDEVREAIAALSGAGSPTVERKPAARKAATKTAATKKATAGKPAKKKPAGR